MENEILCRTSKYDVTKLHNVYRVENIKGRYKTKVPYVEIPKELADEFIDYLVNYKDLGYTKSEGKSEFNKYCDQMFDEEHTELYPEDVM